MVSDQAIGSTVLPAGNKGPSSDSEMPWARRSARPMRAVSSRSCVGWVVRRIAMPVTIAAIGNAISATTRALRPLWRVMSRRATSASARVDAPITAVKPPSW